MTSRTHDLTAFTGLTLAIVFFPIPEMSLATMIGAVGANFIGGLAPDLDEPTAELWQRIRGGSIISRLLSPIFGGHRFISHSLFGIFLADWLLKIYLPHLGTIILVDMHIMRSAFLIGYASHLLSDMMTREGVPLFFPLPFHIGIPPVKKLRIKTGGIVEKSLIFPGLMLFNGFLIWQYYPKFIQLLSLIKQ